MNKKFAFPINYEKMLKTEDLIKWIIWFNKHKLYIYEVYLTPELLGIDYENMNGINYKLSTLEFSNLKKLILHLNKIGIKICYVFNDIFNKKFNNLLLNSLNSTFGKITHSIVVPDKSWIYKIKQINNKIKIKNTVLNLPKFDEIKNGLYDDYDIIYIHDEIIHNHDKFKEIKKNRIFGTVVNFGDCSTTCTFKHQHYNSIKNNKLNDYKVFCLTSLYTYNELLLKRNNIPGFLSEYVYYSDVIDIFKLQGRSSTGTLESAIEIIENIYKENEIITKDYLYLSNNFNNISKWKNYIRNCGGDCLTCSYCNIFEKNNNVS